MAFDFINLPTGGGSAQGAQQSGEVQFPILIFLIALFKDLLDMLTFGFFAVVTTPVTGIIIVWWLVGRPAFKQMSEAERRKLIVGLALRAVGDTLPLIDEWPFLSLFVLKMYKREKKSAGGSLSSSSTAHRRPEADTRLNQNQRSWQQRGPRYASGSVAMRGRA